MGRDHRLGNEAVDRAEDSSLIEVGACRHREHRVQREMSDECGQPAKYQPLDVGKQPVAPIQRCLQGFLPRWRGARPQPQQGQTLVK